MNYKKEVAWSHFEPNYSNATQEMIIKYAIEFIYDNEKIKSNNFIEVLSKLKTETYCTKCDAFLIECDYWSEIISHEDFQDKIGSNFELLLDEGFKILIFIKHCGSGYIEGEVANLN